MVALATLATSFVIDFHINVNSRDTLIILANKLAAKTLHGNYGHFIIRKSSGLIVEKMTFNFQENVMEEWIHC